MCRSFFLNVRCHNVYFACQRFALNWNNFWIKPKVKHRKRGEQTNKKQISPKCLWIFCSLFMLITAFGPKIRHRCAKMAFEKGRAQIQSSATLSSFGSVSAAPRSFISRPNCFSNTPNIFQYFFAARSSSCLVVSVLPRLFLLLKAVWSVFSVCVCVCDRFYVCIFARIYNLDGRFSIWLFVECPRFSQYHQSLQGFWM